ncbi:MAG: NYN domain-containing protein [Verrucomicrobiales bacterium]|nr:NYN domain-containing protein [Verrucomicrobiales bacterium]
MDDAESLRFLLVDGHSVIHAWPELRALHRDAPRRHLAREQLMHQLRLIRDMLGEQVVVVFDGSQSKTTEEREPDGLQIFYADRATTADTILERLAARYASLHPMRVVSADGMVRETIHALGAEWMSPERLLDLVNEAGQRLRQQMRPGR